jgi:hypothetical protein
MRVLDLFCGLKGWSSTWNACTHPFQLDRDAVGRRFGTVPADAGDIVCCDERSSFPLCPGPDEVVTLDFLEKFDATITADILDVDSDRIREAFGGFAPDIILASPPCTAFTVLQIGRNWTKPDDPNPNQPKTDSARMGLAILRKTLTLIEELKPEFWLMENPRAKMRRMPEVAELERRTVTYCQLGENRQKPTDLWGGFPPSLVLPEPCIKGSPCHVAAPRGSYTGTQGMTSEDSAKIPLGLATLVMEAARRDLGADHPPMGQQTFA